MQKNDVYIYEKSRELVGYPGYSNYATLDEVVERLAKEGVIQNVVVTEYGAAERGANGIVYPATKAIIIYQKRKMPQKNE